MREQLFREYQKELEQFFDEPTEEKDILFALNQYKDDEHFEWVDVYDGVELVGFVILGHDLPWVHGEGLYICECYIKPENRRKGIMKRKMRDILTKNKKRVYLQIINTNKTALYFWSYVFRRYRYGKFQNIFTLNNVTEYRVERVEYIKGNELCRE